MCSFGEGPEPELATPDPKCVNVEGNDMTGTAVTAVVSSDGLDLEGKMRAPPPWISFCDSSELFYSIVGKGGGRGRRGGDLLWFPTCCRFSELGVRKPSPAGRFAFTSLSLHLGLGPAGFSPEIEAKPGAAGNFAQNQAAGNPRTGPGASALRRRKQGQACSGRQEALCMPHSHCAWPSSPPLVQMPRGDTSNSNYK